MFWSLIKMQFKNITHLHCTRFGTYGGSACSHPDVGGSGRDLCTLIFCQKSSVPRLHNRALWVTSMPCIQGKRTWYFKFPSLPVGGCCTLHTNPCFLCLWSWKSPCETRGWGTKCTLVRARELGALLPKLPVTGMREGTRGGKHPELEPFPASSRGFVQSSWYFEILRRINWTPPVC